MFRKIKAWIRRNVVIGGLLLAGLYALWGNKIGNWGLKETRKNILKWHNRPKKFKVKVQQPKQLPASKRPALPSAKTTIKTAQKGVKIAQQTAKASAKATIKFVKVAAKAIVAAVKATVAAIKGICSGNCRRRLDCRCGCSPDL